MIAIGWVTNIFQRGAASMGRLQYILTAEPDINDAALRRTPLAACSCATETGTVRAREAARLSNAPGASASLRFAARSSSGI